MNTSNDPQLVVTLLGTGCPPPDRKRMRPSTLIEVENHKMLFDVGRGTARAVFFDICINNIPRIINVKLMY